jgi:mRNA-degrading endonuclease RelE of RelBE toxin-antitoxin system
VKKIFKEVRRLPEFDKDFKKLAKRFKTLNDDIETFINKQLKLTHKLGIDNKGVVYISDLGIEIPKIYKAKKFACKALKGRGGMSGIRIIYAYYESEDVIEFIEIYFKGDKANEDKKRIIKYYSQNIGG